MEEWRKILMASSNPDEVSILDSDVTGVKGSQVAPDGVFYSEFSEEEARAYREIFANFVEVYSISRNIAVSGLEDDLNAQNRSVKGKFCPIELILFSSRCASDIIETDSKAFKVLKKIIGKLLDKDAIKIAQYILGGWEWKTQICVFVEAIGIATPDLVDTAMLYYPQVAALCADDDKNLLKSYINMLISTQDESFAEYFVDVVTNDVFMNDNDAIDYFCKKFPQNSYWRSEKILYKVIGAIESEPISTILRARIAEIKRQYMKKNSQTSQTVYDVLNSRTVDYETKVNWAKKLRFTDNCVGDVFEWEMIRDPESSVIVNQIAMENIDNIMPEEIRGRAYIALATHGKQQKDEIITFLLKQKEEYPIYSFSINIALYHLNVISSDDAFSSLFSEKYYDFYGKNLGKYFRYNKVAISSDFLSFLKRYYKGTLNEKQISYSLSILCCVLEQFNARDGKLADETLGIADNIMKILLAFDGDFEYSSTYNGFMDIFDLIVKEVPSHKAAVLGMLDKFKHYVSMKADMLSVSFRIDNSIKKLDGIVAPTGY